MAESEKFEGWAVVEMLGHKRLAGKVSEQVIAGSALIRVDVPETQHRREVTGFGGHVVEAKPGYTKLIGVGSIYCITPCSEETARAAAEVLERYNDPIPVTLPKLLPAGGASEASDAEWSQVDDVDDEDDDDDRPF